MDVNLFIPDCPPTVKDRRERSHLLRLRSAAFWSLRFVLMHFHPSAFFPFSQLAFTSFSFLSILRKQTLHYTFGDFVRRHWQFHTASRKRASFCSSTSSVKKIAGLDWLCRSSGAPTSFWDCVFSQVLWTVCPSVQQETTETQRTVGFWTLLTSTESHAVLYGYRNLMGEGGDTGTGNVPHQTHTTCPMCLLQEVLNLL